MPNVRIRLKVGDAIADGQSWQLRLPLSIAPGDDIGDPRRSPLRLFEDGTELGPAHAVHADIRGLGGGRFSHWNRTLLFSTPDGSDPRRNGRAYAVEVPQALDLEPAVADLAGYELSIAQHYLTLFARHGIDPKGCDILEIGPGANLGTEILLVAAGARVIVADRFLAAWQPVHATLYAALAQVCDGDPAPLLQAAEQGSTTGIVRAIREPAEALDSLPDDGMGVVLSNAVLEHVEDLDAVARELRRVSKPGAWHFHQVDFRDHTDMARPLEHLLMDPAEFRAWQESHAWTRGCQWRLSDAHAAFVRAGFETVSVTVNERASAGYLEDFLPRLAASRSVYRDRSGDDISTLGALMTLRVPPTK